MFKKVAVICASALVALNFYSCNKNDAPTTQVNEEGLKTVPFFEVAKGDSIAKGILREKPEFDEDVVVLATSEDLLKGESISGGAGYIYDLKVSIRNSNNAPNMQDGYTKLNVDLNEGAGGKWIYLYYKKTDQAISALSYIRSDAVSVLSQIETLFPNLEKLGRTFSNNLWADLNDGAGGKYIKLSGQRYPIIYGYNTGGLAIQNIAVVSSTQSMSSWNGWERVTQDLNEGAGGKYIYIFAQKTIVTQLY
jgi:hypothetical protein